MAKAVTGGSSGADKIPPRTHQRTSLASAGTQAANITASTAIRNAFGDGPEHTIHTEDSDDPQVDCLRWRSRPKQSKPRAFELPSPKRIARTAAYVIRSVLPASTASVKWQPCGFWRAKARFVPVHDKGRYYLHKKLFIHSFMAL
jgi:hypothetical protein